MRVPPVALLAVLPVLAVAACQEQSTVVVEQSSAAALAANNAALPRPIPRPAPPPSPCAAPAGTGPFEHLTHPVSSADVPMPPKALADHVNGCAGIRFRIGPTGAPQDIQALAEYPLGYGFAHTAAAAVAATRWPARDDTAWRYLIINMHPGAPAPS
jgi:hypothetical protein